MAKQPKQAKQSKTPKTELVPIEADAPQANAQGTDDLAVLEKIARQASYKELRGLFTAINVHGYESVRSRFLIVDILWSAVETYCKTSKIDLNLIERYSIAKTRTRLLSSDVRKGHLVNIMLLCGGMLFFKGDENNTPNPLNPTGFRISENTYAIWCDFARHKEDLEKWRPASHIDARRLLTALRTKNEEFFKNLKDECYFLDDTDDPIKVAKESEAWGSSSASKRGRKPGSTRPKEKTLPELHEEFIAIIQALLEREDADKYLLTFIVNFNHLVASYFERKGHDPKEIEEVFMDCLNRALKNGVEIG